MEYKTVSQGCKYVSSVIDHLTRLVILAAIANKEATTIARTLVDRVFSVFGVPELLHSDMGKHFDNQLVKKLQTVFGYKKLVTRLTGHKVIQFWSEHTAPCVTC